MPKVKTSSAAKKRFKKVGGKKGKIKRADAFRRHLLTKKSSKRKRQLRKGSYISEADHRNIARLLPY
jgi:large subunit ribosomal protein L35